MTTISDSQFVGNQAGQSGGAILISGDSATIRRTTFDGNTAVAGGGGVFSAGDLSVTDSTFKNNTTPDVGGGMALNNSGTTTIERTTFSSNTASNSGGAIWGPNNSGSLTISNSTVSNNTAACAGGLLALLTTTISSSTFADNHGTNLILRARPCAPSPVSATAPAAAWADAGVVPAGEPPALASETQLTDLDIMDGFSPRD